MFNPRILAFGLAFLSLGAAAAATAQEFEPNIRARQGTMRIQAFNVGILANMARGNTEYDAEAAQIAADNLVALTAINPRGYWPEGSDNASVENTRALPVIWEDQAGFGNRWQAYGAAAMEMQGAAGGGLEALRGAMGALGGACGACHDDYRQSDD